MRPILLMSFLMVGAAFAQAQTGIFSITADKPGAIDWNKVRNADAQQGQWLFDAAAPTYFIDGLTRRKTTPQINGMGPDDSNPSVGLAALGYDPENNRLYFAPLFRDGGIRYIDLNKAGAQKPIVLLQESYALLERSKDGEGKNITRMAIAGNGKGYAISNDGNNFYRFSTKNNNPVENLGPLVDDEKNGTVSVHNSCSGWGGDIVAAANGDLYLFTMRHQVFKINPANRVASFLGTIQGLDASFLVNGAAVNEKGEVVLASSIEAGKKWVIHDMQSLEAKLIEDPHWLNASDLASGHLLFAKAAAPAPAANRAVAPVSDVSVFPNPVSNQSLTVVFSGQHPGRYQIDLLNAAGVGASSKTVQVQQRGHTEKMSIRNLSKGWYVLRVTNASMRVTHSEKVLIQ
jgi:hypothetical protein